MTEVEYFYNMCTYASVIFDRNTATHLFMKYLITPRIYSSLHATYISLYHIYTISLYKHIRVSMTWNEVLYNNTVKVAAISYSYFISYILI